MKILLLGLPGCGKGTQGALLSAALSIPHISVGDVVRKELARQSPLGQEIAQDIENNNRDRSAAGHIHTGWSPLRDDLALRVVEQEVAGHNSFVLDGFPRTAVQARSMPFAPNKIFFLSLSEEECRARYLARKREGDSLAKFESRLAAEECRLPKVLAAFYGTYPFLYVDARGTEEQIFQCILKNLPTAN